MSTAPVLVLHWGAVHVKLVVASVMQPSAVYRELPNASL